MNSLHPLIFSSCPADPWDAASWAEPGAPGPDISILTQVQQEHINSLTRKVEELQLALELSEKHSERIEELHATERGDLITAYEQMISEQTVAVRQYESRASSVGTLRSEVRKRKDELKQAEAGTVALRQLLTTISKVWRHSIFDLESSLEVEIRWRDTMEADRVKFADIHRKKLHMLQREVVSLGVLAADQPCPIVSYTSFRTSSFGAFGIVRRTWCYGRSAAMPRCGRRGQGRTLCGFPCGDAATVRVVSTAICILHYCRRPLRLWVRCRLVSPCWSLCIIGS